MELDDKTLFHAVEARDRSFDGRFWFGVVTTGIYCRPGCPSPPPRRRNLRFFPSPTAAEQAGLRPCLRCHPRAPTGAAAALGTRATVARALRLIAGGSLDEAGVDELAARLGIGERHLRRLFAEQLGASPIEVARSFRIRLARRLIEETHQPMSEVALAAGFSSTRRFNDEIRKAFGQSPSELRGAARH
jgi:AraC family transcriptional regulator of adaptative response / DNA-3-methyladenine glycosylase II